MPPHPSSTVWQGWRCLGADLFTLAASLPGALLFVLRRPSPVRPQKIACRPHRPNARVPIFIPTIPHCLSLRPRRLQFSTTRGSRVSACLHMFAGQPQPSDQRGTMVWDPALQSHLTSRLLTERTSLPRLRTRALRLDIHRHRRETRHFAGPSPLRRHHRCASRRRPDHRPSLDPRAADQADSHNQARRQAARTAGRHGLSRHLSTVPPQAWRQHLAPESPRLWATEMPCHSCSRRRSARCATVSRFSTATATA